jgi:hypothetical protein
MPVTNSIFLCVYEVSSLKSSCHTDAANRVYTAEDLNRIDLASASPYSQYGPYQLTNQKPARKNTFFPFSPEVLVLAKRSARYIEEKIRAMRLSSKLLEDLWTEITRAAIYCVNPVPRRRHDWKSLYEVFYKAVAQMEGDPL